MSISIDDLPSELQTLIESHVDPLEPITPDEAISEFIDDKRDDITPKTADDYEKKLEYVREYFNKIGLENLNELNGREIKGYSKWRKHESSDNVDELSKKTMRDDLYLFADFLRFAEMIDAVEEETAEKVDPPNLDHGEGVRDVELEIDFIKDVTHYLSKYHYGSREHVVFKIIEETGRRLGCIHSLDLSDANLSGSDPYLEFRHHDDRNTRLKNKEKSEQDVNISEQLAELIQDYIEKQRINKEIDGRKPLLTTSHGRLAKGTIRTYFYQWTRPCKIGKSCPDDRNPEDCQAACSKDKASKCPASEAPHAARHGYLTEMRRQGVPKEVLSDRCDVSEEIIEEVYDERSEEEKRELRRKVMKEALDEEGV
jgi:site-specific recombinase XerD